LIKPSLVSIQPNQNILAHCLNNINHMSLDPLSLHQKYATNGMAYQIVVAHSQAVTNKALEIAKKFSQIDSDFIYEASMLHDIGVYFVHAPKIFCFGSEPYLKHTVIGAEILLKEGLPKHARVAETHTGVGIDAAEIVANNLPLPVKDYHPETLEEKIISYADLFFSKSKFTDSDLQGLFEPESITEIIQELARYGQNKVAIFLSWQQLFEPELGSGN